MSTYRSERAQRRAAKLRTTRLATIFVILALLGYGAYLLFIDKAPLNSVPATANPALNSPPAFTNPQTLPSGLQFEDLEVGQGALAEPGKSLQVHYTGWLLDGTKFDSSRDRGQPFSLVLGAHQVISGWEEGLEGMRVGGKRLLKIPADLGYGASGAGSVIPPNADLIFEVELVDVK